MKRHFQLVAAVVGWGTLAAAARAEIIVPGADDSDGALTVTSNKTIDLSLARTGAWDSPHSDPNEIGRGVYDPDQWAVVFRYSSVTIDTSRMLSFVNHPSGAPVVWLVSGNVTINGWVDLRGRCSPNGNVGIPGPGGFRGSRGAFDGNPGSGGFGPGGGRYPNRSGSYATAGQGASPSVTYGNAAIVPLIGGSGGCNNGAGPAGGGAILIACENAVDVTGLILADGAGCTNYSSGGAIRLVTSHVTGSGLLSATGFSGGGLGRVRIERVSGPTLSASPAPSVVEIAPGSVAKLWPDASAPRIRCVSLDGLAIPDDPRASLAFPQQDVTIATPDPLLLVIETANIPVPPAPDAWMVTARMVPLSGPDFEVTAVYQSTALNGVSTWHAVLERELSLGLPNGFTAIQARAFKP